MRVDRDVPGRPRQNSSVPRHGGHVGPSPRTGYPGATAVRITPQSALALQRRVGNAAVTSVVGGAVQRDVVIQRTIDQDARRWAMDWLATAARPFVTGVRHLGLNRLGSICDAVLGERFALVGAPAPTRVDRAKSSTGLAAALVSMGEAQAGQLAKRLSEAPFRIERAKDLLAELEEHVPETLPELHLESPASALKFQELPSKLKDPFLTLVSSGTTFHFSKEMALHMMRRHHPDYIEGDPMQVQSFFEPGSSIQQIQALVTGTVMASSEEIKAWRKARAAKKADLDALRNLNLRPFFDGKHWELTLELPSTNPHAATGTVAHFTPTL